MCMYNCTYAFTYGFMCVYEYSCIFSYIEYHRLIEGLIELSIPIYLHITLKDFQQYFKQINDFQWPEYVRFNILIDNLYDELIIPLQNIQAQIKLSVLVFSEKDYLLLSEKIKNKSISDTRIIPIYNSQNLDFFKSNVFTDLDELSNIVLTKQEIFMRQSLNILNFGKLTIMPDGTVYANVNYEPLGLIDDTVYSLVYKEFAEGQSWLQIRNQVPCANCIYQWLCPSPSNYETAIGQQNLCSIKL